MESEIQAYAGHIQVILAGASPKIVATYFPLQPDDFFYAFEDGVLLGHLLAAVRPGSIDVSKLKIKNNQSDALLSIVDQTKAVFNVTLNLNYVIESAKKAGFVVVNIGAQDFLTHNKDLVLGLVWQLIRVNVLQELNFIKHPELIRLLEPSETILQLTKLTSEQLLVRWFNYHLARAGCNRRITNFSSDVMDGVLYLELLAKLAGTNEEIRQRCVDAKALREPLERAKVVIEVAEFFNARHFVTPRDIISGAGRLNLAFTATLFSHQIGIFLPTDEEVTTMLKNQYELTAKLNSLSVALREKDAALVSKDSAIQDLSQRLAELDTKYVESQRHMERNLQRRTSDLSEITEQLSRSIDGERRRSNTITKLNSRMQELQTQYDTMQAKLKTEVDQKQAALVDVSQRLAKYEGDEAKRTQIIRELTEKVQQMQAEYEDMYTKLARELEDKTKKVAFLEEKLARSEFEDKRKGAAITELSDKVKDLQKQVSEVSIKKDRELEQKQQSLTEMGDQLARSLIEDKQKAAAMREMSEKLKQAQTEFADLQIKKEREVEDKLKTVHEVSEQLWRIQIEEKSKETAMNDLSEKLLLAKTQYAALRDERQKELDGKQAVIANLEGRIAQYHEEEKNKAIVIRELTAALEEAEARYTQLEAAMEQNLGEKHKSIHELSDQLSKTRGQDESKNETIRRLTEQLEALEAQYAALEQEKDRAVGNKQQSVIDLADQLSKTQLEDQTKNEIIRDLTFKLQQLEAQYKDLMERRERDIQENRRSVIELTEQLARTQMEDNSKRDLVQQLSKKLTKMESDYIDLQTRRDRDLHEKQQSLAEMSEKLSRTQTEEAARATRIHELTERLQRAEIEYSDLLLRTERDVGEKNKSILDLSDQLSRTRQDEVKKSEEVKFLREQLALARKAQAAKLDEEPAPAAAQQRPFEGAIRMYSLNVFVVSSLLFLLK